MNAFLNYPGAKWGAAEQIVSMMPGHRSYIEPYFGSGAVLFNKPPAPIETVNDIDGDITNFFEVLKKYPEKLAEAVMLTPYSRDVFDNAHKNYGRSKFDRAYRFCIRSRMAHGYKVNQKTGFKIDVYGRERSYSVDCWNKTPELLLEAASRLKNVQIENRPAIDIIKKFNHKEVLAYIDPPYVLSTRFQKQYKYEMEDSEHEELLHELLRFRGFVILSGYHSELYDNALSGWFMQEFISYNQNSAARTEVIWTNFEPPAMQLSIGQEG